MPRVKIPAVLACLAALCSMVALVPQAQAATFEGRELIYRKHADAVHIVWTGTGLDIKVNEGYNTIRNAADVAIRLGPDADQDGYEVSRLRVPDDDAYAFMGKPGDIVWHAPQQLYEGWPPVWAGIGHGELPAGMTNLRLTLVDAGGPGRVELYRTIGMAGTPERELSSSDEQLRSFEPGSHGHYSWIFTKPGVYRMQWQATATLSDGKEVSSPVVTVPWLVGTDAQVGLPEGTTKGAPITHPVDESPAPPSATPTPSDEANPTPSTEPTPTAAPTSSPSVPPRFADNPTKQLPNCTSVATGHMDISTVLNGDGGLWMRSVLDSPSGREVLPWNGAVLDLPNSAKQSIPDGVPAADLREALGTAEAWELPESQNKTLPWPGFSTEELDYANIEQLTYQVESWEGPDGGAWAIGGFNSARRKFVVQADSANYASQTIALPQGSHMHTGWYFSKPGYYTLTLKAEATPKDASKMAKWQRADTLPVTFAVSDEAVAFACNRNGEGLVSPDGASPKPTEPASVSGDDNSGELDPAGSTSSEGNNGVRGEEAASGVPVAEGAKSAGGAAPGLPSTGV